MPDKRVKVWDSTRLDINVSKTVAKRVGAVDKNCFLNSLHALMTLPDAARYVEGYVVSDDFQLVMDHAWIEMDGQIIDCTPIYHSGRTTRRYFPVDRYSRDQVRVKIARKENVLLPFQQMPWRVKRWIAANEQAQRYAYGDATYEKLISFRNNLTKTGTE